MASAGRNVARDDRNDFEVGPSPPSNKGMKLTKPRQLRELRSLSPALGGAGRSRLLRVIAGGMNSVSFDRQPVLLGELLELRPLRADDFDALFRVAADQCVEVVRKIGRAHV